MRSTPTAIYPYRPLRHVAAPPLDWRSHSGGGMGRLCEWTLHATKDSPELCTWTIINPEGELWARGSDRTLDAAKAFASERMAVAAGCSDWRTPLVQCEQAWVVTTSYTLAFSNGSLTGPGTYAPGVILELTHRSSVALQRHPDDGAQFPSVHHAEDHLVDIGVYALAQPAH